MNDFVYINKTCKCHTYYEKDIKGITPVTTNYRNSHISNSNYHCF